MTDQPPGERPKRVPGWLIAVLVASILIFFGFMILMATMIFSGGGG